MSITRRQWCKICSAVICVPQLCAPKTGAELLSESDKKLAEVFRTSMDKMCEQMEQKTK